jgi:hypothetical protein
MLEVLGGGVLGSLIGGAFRLAPEVLKWLDRKNERQHELAMFERQVDLEKTRGQIKLDEIGAQRNLAVDTGVLDAFNAAITQQTEIVKAAGGLAAKLSASVRPVATYWILLVWSIAHVGLAFTSARAGVPMAEIYKSVLTADFMALVSGTLNYWFLDRTLKARGL